MLVQVEDPDGRTAEPEEDYDDEEDSDEWVSLLFFLDVLLKTPSVSERIVYSSRCSFMEASSSGPTLVSHD